MPRYRVLLLALVFAMVAGLPGISGQDLAQEPTTPKERPKSVKRLVRVSERAKEFLRVATESKTTLVRKRAAMALARMGTDARSVAADVKAALKTEPDGEVKKALEEALEAIDPPLQQLPLNELIQRLQESTDLETRKEIVRALGDRRLSGYVQVRSVLENLLLDDDLAGDAAASLERLDEYRRKSAEKRE